MRSFPQCASIERATGGWKASGNRSATKRANRGTQGRVAALKKRVYYGGTVSDAVGKVKENVNDIGYREPDGEHQARHQAMGPGSGMSASAKPLARRIQLSQARQGCPSWVGS